MQELVLYNMPVQRVNETKSIPGKYSVNVAVPPCVLRKHKAEKFGSILVDGDDIFFYSGFPELINVILKKETYSMRIKENNEYISVRVPALDIFLNYESFLLLQKEDKTITPVLHNVPKPYLTRWDDTSNYHLRISFPKRLLPYFEDKNPGEIVYAILYSQDVQPVSDKFFDVTLNYTFYSIYLLLDDGKPIYKISRSELIEAYNNSQQIRAESMNEQTERIMEQTDTAPDPFVLRHLFRKNIHSSSDGILTIAVPVPASLKGKSTRWFCTLHVPESCVTPEPTIANTELISLTLTQKTYDADYPVSDLGEYHKLHQTHWETATVTREEIYEAHMQTLQTFDFYLRNGLS